MKINFKKHLVYFVAIAFIFSFSKNVQAVNILDDAYLLSNADILSPGQNAVIVPVKLNGTVYPLNQGGNPSLAEVYYKTQKINSNDPAVTHPTFSPNANGSFEQTLQGFECGQTYNFWLYESTDDTLINVSVIGVDNLAFAFSMPMMCSGNALGSLEDIQVPALAGALTISAVNWGNVNVTDHSISISNGYIVPTVYGGPKTFVVEYGTGVPDGNNQPTNSQFLGYSSIISRVPPYNFSLQIGSLAPNTNYYFNLWEVYTDQNTQQQILTNLFTYGYTQTDQITSSSALNYTFPNATSVRVFGNLTNNDGQPIIGAPLDIEIRASSDPNSTLINSASVITVSDFINGNGFYSYNFTDVLNSDTVYYLFLRNSNNQNLVYGPTQITTPSPINTTPGNQNPLPDMPENGLIACTGVDCNFNSFIETINRVINFLIVFIAFPVVAIVVAWAGVKLILSGGNESAKSYAKEVLRKVLIGFIVALLCWSIVKLILITLGYVPQGALWEILGTSPSN